MNCQPRLVLSLPQSNNKIKDIYQDFLGLIGAKTKAPPPTENDFYNTYYKLIPYNIDYTEWFGLIFFIPPRNKIPSYIPWWISSVNQSPIEPNLKTPQERWYWLTYPNMAIRLPSKYFLPKVQTTLSPNNVNYIKYDPVKYYDQFLNDITTEEVLECYKQVVINKFPEWYIDKNQVLMTESKPLFGWVDLYAVRIPNIDIPSWFVVPSYSGDWQKTLRDNWNWVKSKNYILTFTKNRFISNSEASDIYKKWLTQNGYSNWVLEPPKTCNIM